MKLMTAETDSARFDVYLTDQDPGVSVIRDDGHISATKWTSIGEAVAFLIGSGCEIDNVLDNREAIDAALTEKYHR